MRLRRSKIPWMLKQEALIEVLTTYCEKTPNLPHAKKLLADCKQTQTNESIRKLLVSVINRDEIINVDGSNEEFLILLSKQLSQFPAVKEKDTKNVEKHPNKSHCSFWPQPNADIRAAAVAATAVASAERYISVATA